MPSVSTIRPPADAAVVSVDGDPSDSRLDPLLRRWATGPLAEHFIARERLASLPPRTVDLPGWLCPALRDALEQRGIAALYTHQLEVIELLRSGRDAVIATPTASGKSLCYNLYALQSIAEDRSSRALYLFPTKALARDQVEGLRGLAAALEPAVGVAVYDGDTPADQRRRAKSAAQIIATNPDMLHAGILPHHPRWAAFFAGLRLIVVDELHTYRGVFGGHLANVLARLLRIAAFHGAAPRLVASSATIANPGQLATRLFGRPPVEVCDSGAPRGARHFWIYNPPLIDRGLGLRESYLKAACKLTRQLTGAGLRTLVFCRSRLAVEVLVRYLRDTLPVAPAGIDLPADRSVLDDRVRGYRGGYLPDRRRGVERALRAGDTDVVVATSALELGIDIGSLDAVVLAGWPGSRAAAWQRAGRAGRRLAPSLCVLVSSSEPTDQYVAEEPAYLFGQPAEYAQVDPENPAVLIGHLKCAAFELPFRPGEAHGGLSADETREALGQLSHAGLLHRRGDHFHYIDSRYPAAELPLRGPLDENFLVVDEPRGSILAEVDYRDAPETLHRHAIYQLEGRQYEVERLDHEAHKAFVRAIDVDYYTQAMTHTELRVLEQLGRHRACQLGEVHVNARVVGFKKIKLHTHENIGYGEVDEPDRQMHSTAVWFDLAPAVLGRAREAHSPERGRCSRPGGGGGWTHQQLSGPRFAEAALAFSYVLHSTAALLSMSSRSDIGRAVGDRRSETFTAIERADRRGPFSSAPPDNPREGAALLTGLTVFLYDRCPGGSGLAAQLYQRSDELLERTADRARGCGCDAGCPACVGAASSAEAKRRAAQIAKALASEL